MVNHTSAIYIEHNIELSWSIESSANYDEYHLGELRDWF